MSIMHRDVSAGRAHPNAELTAGLRELADFLDAHPELPEFGASAGLYAFTTEERCRQMLSAVAEALGDRARELVERNNVEIRAEFGPVRVYASTPAKNLGGIVSEPTLDYEPIIKTAAKS